MADLLALVLNLWPGHNALIVIFLSKCSRRGSVTEKLHHMSYK